MISPRLRCPARMGQRRSAQLLLDFYFWNIWGLTWFGVDVEDRVSVHDEGGYREECNE